MKTQPLSLDLLRLDGGTQSRLHINEDTVEDYSDIIRVAPPGEWPFPPADVFHDGSEYFVADGFHRCLGAKRAGRASVPCVIHQGTAKDARIFSMTANDKHGLRLSRADKRAAVEWLLDNGGKLTQKEIAEKAGVGTRLVQTVVAERNPKSIAGKATPPKRDSEAHNAPSTPIGGGALSDFDVSMLQDMEPPSDDIVPLRPKKGDKAKGGGSKPITAKTGRSSAIWEAQQVMKTWVDAIGRWMNGNPAGIDAYREKFPGPLGDRALDAAKAFLNALDAWKKGLK